MHYCPYFNLTLCNILQKYLLKLVVFPQRYFIFYYMYSI